MGNTVTNSTLTTYQQNLGWFSSAPSAEFTDPNPSPLPIRDGSLLNGDGQNGQVTTYYVKLRPGGDIILGDDWRGVAVGAESFNSSENGPQTQRMHFRTRNSNFRITTGIFRGDLTDYPDRVAVDCSGAITTEYGTNEKYSRPGITDPLASGQTRVTCGSTPQK